MKKNIGIVINFGPTQWFGGLNFFINFYNLIKNSDFKLKVFCKKKNKNYYKKIFKKANFIDIEEFSEPKNFLGTVSKLKILFFGKDENLEKFLLKKKINYFIFSGYLGRNSNIFDLPIIWDFQEFTNPSNFSFKERILRHFNFFMCATNSTKVILSSKHDLSIFKKFEKNKKKSFLFNLPDTLYSFKLLSKNLILKKFNIKNKKFYILPNQYRKHKNHILVLKALKYIKQKYLKNILIVSTGNITDWRHKDNFENIKNYIRNNQLKKNYKILKMVSHNDLLNLIYYSIALINPSKAEGESGSVEMAKAFGKRTLLSNIDVHIDQNPNRVNFFKCSDYKKLSGDLIKFNKNVNFNKELNYSKIEIKRHHVLIKEAKEKILSFLNNLK